MNTKLITFDYLAKELDIKDPKDLEDLIIDSIYAGLVEGKIN